MGENGVSHCHEQVTDLQMESNGPKNNTQHPETGDGSSSKRSRPHSRDSSHRQALAQPSTEMSSVTQSSKKKKSKSEIIDREVFACRFNFNWIIFYFIK